MFDPEREQLEAEIVRLRAIVEAQAALIAELRSKLEDLQSLLDRDSSNSSLPPSRDRTDRRARRAAERAEAKATNKALGKAARAPGKQMDPGKPYHADDAVFLEVAASGTHRGAWAGLDPTDRSFSVRVGCLFEFEEDRLIGERIYFDLATILRQLWANEGLRR